MIGYTSLEAWMAVLFVTVIIVVVPDIIKMVRKFIRDVLCTYKRKVRSRRYRKVERPD